MPELRPPVNKISLLNEIKWLTATLSVAVVVEDSVEDEACRFHLPHNTWL